MFRFVKTGKIQGETRKYKIRINLCDCMCMQCAHAHAQKARKEIHKSAKFMHTHIRTLAESIETKTRKVVQMAHVRLARAFI